MTRVILSLSKRAERIMVTTGQAKMMQRASGTAMKLTQASEQMKATAPVRPEEQLRSVGEKKNKRPCRRV